MSVDFSFSRPSSQKRGVSLRVDRWGVVGSNQMNMRLSECVIVGSREPNPAGTEFNHHQRWRVSQCVRCVCVVDR